LGGIANISFDDENGVRKAFDICHVNMVNNYIAKNYFGKEYDEDSEITLKGKMNQELN
jgi:1,6-anhydro-N-acetylmuramate kinase